MPSLKTFLSLNNFIIICFSFDLPHILNRRASSITGAALQQQQQQQQQQSDAPGTLSRQGSAIFAFNFTPVIPGKHFCLCHDTFFPTHSNTLINVAFIHFQNTLLRQHPTSCT
jgi:hypothetical protein